MAVTFLVPLVAGTVLGVIVASVLWVQRLAKEQECIHSLMTESSKLRSELAWLWFQFEKCQSRNRTLKKALKHEREK